MLAWFLKDEMNMDNCNMDLVNITGFIYSAVLYFSNLKMKQNTMSEKNLYSFLFSTFFTIDHSVYIFF